MSTVVADNAWEEERAAIDSIDSRRRGEPLKCVLSDDVARSGEPSSRPQLRKDVARNGEPSIRLLRAGPPCALLVVYNISRIEPR